MYAEQQNWTNEERITIENDCEQMGVLQNITERRPYRNKEFPNVEVIMIKEPNTHMFQLNLNRKQRRAQKT